MPLTVAWADAFLGAVSYRPYFGDAVLRLVVGVGSNQVVLSPVSSFKYRVTHSDYVSMNFVGLFNVSAYIGSGVLDTLRLVMTSGSGTVFAFVSLGSSSISDQYVLYRLELKFPHSGSCPF